MKKLLFLAAFILLGAIAGPVMAGISASEHGTPVAVQVQPAYGAAGGTATVKISFDSGGQAVAGFQINLEFNGAMLPGASGAAGPTLPAGWLMVPNLAAPGELRFLAVDMTGVGAVLTGDVLTAEFTIPAGVPPQAIAITVGLAEVIDAGNQFLPVTVTSGAVTVVVCGDVALPADGLVSLPDVIALLWILIGRDQPTPAQIFTGDVGIGAVGGGGINLGDVVLLVQHITGRVAIGGCGPG